MRKFNVTGTCIKSRHYVANTDEKIKKIIDLIDDEYYFTINRPRQYGKTTTLELLHQSLNEEYLVLSLSLENVGKESYIDAKTFIKMLYDKIKDQLEMLSADDLIPLVEQMKDLESFHDLSRFITRFAKESDKETILIIDEVDDGSNNAIFLKFLGVLRSKYLLRTTKRDVTFKSVILAGVHDVKNLRHKVRDGDDAQDNSPWNIAEDFNVDMSLSELEIASLLEDYLTEHPEMQLDIPVIASKIHYFTNGYPFLASYLCKMIDEQFTGVDKWSIHNLEQAVNKLLLIKNSNFDSLIKNLKNHQDLASLVHSILLEGEDIEYSVSGEAMEKGLMYGVLACGADNKFIIHNPIYEMKIYSYLTDEMKTKSKSLLKQRPVAQYLTDNGALDLELMMEKYSAYLKDLHDDHRDSFIEENARLLLSIFIKTIINGVGFMYREPVISDRRRLDVLIVYNQFKYLIELKIWHGDSYYEKAKAQLADYLARENLDVGYMIIHDFRKERHQRFTNEIVTVAGKTLKVYFV